MKLMALLMLAQAVIAATSPQPKKVLLDQDAYPEATPTGTVALSAFTTKLAIYALARAFPGTEYLIWIGASMTALPVFFAVITIGRPTAARCWSPAM